MEVQLFCYLVLLSTDGKSMQQDSGTSMTWPIYSIYVRKRNNDIKGWVTCKLFPKGIHLFQPVDRSSLEEEVTVLNMRASMKQDDYINMEETGHNDEKNMNVC